MTPRTQRPKQLHQQQSRLALGLTVAAILIAATAAIVGVSGQQYQPSQSYAYRTRQPARSSASSEPSAAAEFASKLTAIVRAAATTKTAVPASRSVTPSTDGSSSLADPQLFASSVRPYMQTANTPQSMNDAAARFIHAIDRRTLANEVAPNYPDFDVMGGVEDPVYPGDDKTPYASGSARQDAVEARGRTYGEGIATIAVGVPLALSIVCMFGWALFCWIRCCCDSCGGRGATQKYTAEQRNVCRVLLVVNFAFMIIVFGFGLSSNAGVSDSVDETLKASDQAVEYMFSYHVIMNQAVGVLTDAFGRMSALNDTINSALPSLAQIGNYSECINQTYATLHFNEVLLASVIYLRNTTREMPNLYAFSGQLLGLQRNITALPNLKLMEQQMINLNTSMGHLPEGRVVSGQLADLNTSFVAYMHSPNITNGIIKLQNNLRGFNTHDYSDPLDRDERAIRALPDLSDLATDVQGGPSSSYSETLQNLEHVYDNLTVIQRYPNPAEYAARLRVLNTTLIALNSSFELIGQVEQLQTIIRGVPDLRPLNNSILAIKQFSIVAPPQIAVLKVSVARADVSIKGFPDMDRFYHSIANVKLGTDKLSAANIPRTMEQMLIFNRSLPQLACILPLFDTLEAINNTLVELPEGLNDTLALKPDIVRTLANLTSLYAKINSGYQSLSNLNATLHRLPDFAKMLNQTAEVNRTLNNLPNMTDVMYQLNDLNNSIASLPDLDDYSRQLTKLNDSLSVPNLDTLLSQMQSLRGTVNTLPDLAQYVNHSLLLNDSMARTLPLVQQSISSMQTLGGGAWQTASPTGGVQPLTLQNALVAALIGLDSTTRSRPNATALIEDLSDINRTISNLPDLTEMRQNTQDLDDSITSFPSLDDLQKDTANLDRARSGQSGLTKTIKDGTLSALNKSISDLPDLVDAAKNSRDAQGDIDGADFDGVINELEQNSDNSFDDASRANAIDQLNNLKTFRETMPDINDLLTTLNDTMISGVDAQHSLVTYRNDYYYYRNLGYLYASEYDGQRVLFINVLFFMPMFLAVFGILGCVLQKPCPLMWMSLSSIPTMSILFFFCALVMFPTVVVDDFCVERHTIIQTNLQHMEIAASTLELGRDDSKPGQTGLFNTSASGNITAADVYRYFLTCDEPKVNSLIVQMQNPSEMLERAGFNFSGQVNGVRSSAAEQGFKLRPRLDSQLMGFDDAYLGAQQTIINLGAATQCSDTNAMHLSLDAFYAGVCDKLMTSLAMCTALLFIAAACSCPGVCIGIRAYKRLDPNNFSARVMKDEEDHPDGVNAMEDGHAAAAARDAEKIEKLKAERAKASPAPLTGTQSHHGQHPHAGHHQHGSHRQSAPIGSSIDGKSAVAGAPRHHPQPSTGGGGGRPQGVEMGQTVKPLQFDAAGNLIS